MTQHRDPQRRATTGLRLSVAVLCLAGLLVTGAGLMGMALMVHQFTAEPLAWALGVVIGLDLLAVLWMWRSSRVR